MLAKCIHERHQPIETGMAFQRYAQTSRCLLGHLRDTAFGRMDFFQHFAGQRNQAFSGVREFDGLALAAHDGHSIMVLQCFDLMR